MQVVFEDGQVLVVEKPPGRDSTDLPGPVLVVHRLDKLTSGLLVYAKTPSVARRLARQFAAHSVERRYACVAQGRVESGTFSSSLVRDRGDGLRGSGAGGKPAITHVQVLRADGECTHCSVTLETGRTHQIRIHFAEHGTPLVGETVYVRDFKARGGVPLPSSRLMLHAAALGFTHPVTKERLRFSSVVPWDDTARNGERSTG